VLRGPRVQLATGLSHIKEKPTSLPVATHIALAAQYRQFHSARVGPRRTVVNSQ